MKGIDALRRPKVLVLTPRYPYPVIGGDRLRIFQICKELAQTCSLTLLSLCESLDEMNAPLVSDGVFARVERVYLPRWRSALNALLALPSQTPLQVAYYRSSSFAHQVEALLGQHDVCLAHLIRTGHYVREAKLPRVLEMTDAISLNYQRVKSHTTKRGWKSRIYSLEANRLEAYERAAIKEFDAATLVSHIDRDFLLSGQIMPNVVVCSNGVDLAAFPYQERQTRERVVVFIGNLTSMQNMDACQHFIDDLLPLLLKLGEFRFRIIGRISLAEAARLGAYPGVEVLANVDNVPDAVGNAFAAVAPVRLGAGVQNKVLEYMALGIPTITSTVGLEGLHAKPGIEILVADAPDVWVAQLLHLWNRPDHASELSRAGRAYVEREHAWSARLSPLVDIVHNLAKRPENNTGCLYQTGVSSM